MGSRLKNHGVIAYTPSRLPGILSFLLTGALLAAALLLTSGQSLDDGGYRNVLRSVEAPDAGAKG